MGKAEKVTQLGFGKGSILYFGPYQSISVHCRPQQERPKFSDETKVYLQLDEQQRDNLPPAEARGEGVRPSSLLG